MLEFFTYDSPYRTGVFMELSFLEKYGPIFLIIIGAILIAKYRNIFKKNPLLDRNFRIIIGIIFMVIYLSHYLLNFLLYGFDTIVLPFQLCSISMFLAIILIFTKNRTVFSFVLYTGVIGGLISVFVPVIGYDSTFYRYYQYEIAHAILILTPIYFIFVHDYIPNVKETIYAYLILQFFAKFMLVFNYFYHTDFMFVFLDPIKIEKFPVIEKFGGIPLYLIWVEIAAVVAFIISYQAVHFFTKNKKEFK
ncbi:MAG: TIGR02206 family membrane protein [Firmicutes bacterium]|nr:TIGR02206 family membrane protein [Bacillota bacterium]